MILLLLLAGATQVGFNRVSGNLLATAHDGLYIHLKYINLFEEKTRSINYSLCIFFV